MPVHTPGGSNPRGLQLWIDLPKAEKMSEPLYQELKSTEVSFFDLRLPFATRFFADLLCLSDLNSLPF